MKQTGFTVACTVIQCNANNTYLKLYTSCYTDPIASVQEIAPVYPLNKDVPMLICWTPPPAYMVAPIIHYHLKLSALTSDANRGDVSNVVLPAELGTCATMDNNSLHNSSNGGIFALSLAAENALGMSAYTSTSVVVSLFEGQSVAKIIIIIVVHVVVILHANSTFSYAHRMQIHMYVCT